MAKQLLAIDQGTTGSTALVVSLEGETLGRASFEFSQHYPQAGWVEHDPDEIWQSVERAVKKALADASVTGADIGAIGITNQRETTLLWERKSGLPIANAIVWQCRRTAKRCDELKRAGHENMVRERTGLVIDAYFSGTKIEWLLDHVDGARARAERGELAFGTIDTYVIHRLTGGRTHAIDVTNASRTLLMDLDKRVWDESLAELLRVPMQVLPSIVPSAGAIGETRGLGFLPDGIPITGVAGDQHAALFGQACFSEGDSKCTYGTGAFALMNVGARPVPSKHGLVATMGWQIGDDVTYALEGSAFIAGAAVQWIRDGLGLIRSAEEIEGLAASVPDADGVVFVPALAGLGAPHWDAEARGLLTGITRRTTSAHIARAVLDGIAFQVWDLLDAMSRDADRGIRRLRVDGGAAKNNLLMQFQADIAQVEVERPTDVESTARGAAMLAAVGAGMATKERAADLFRLDKRFAPAMAADERERALDAWALAVRRARTHA